MSRKRILFIVLIISALSGLFIMRSKPNNPIPTDSVSTGGATTNLNNDFVSALIGVEKVVLDTNIFNSPVFESLVPSGAIVDPNPLKGRVDPFSKISGANEVYIDNGPDVNPRLDNLGPASSSVSSAEIKISKLTTTTATISISGIPQGLNISGTLIDQSGLEVALPLFSYKIVNNEYSYIATGLQSKKTYTIKIEDPSEYSGLQANFTTK